MRTLGINWVWHDPAAAIVDNGQVVAMAEEERFNRSKHSRNRLPKYSASWCLAFAGIDSSDLDAVAVGWDIPSMGATPFVDREDLFRGLFGDRAGQMRNVDLVWVDHHKAHAASTFYASSYSDAAVLVMDGSGEDQSISIFDATTDRGLRLVHQWGINCSLGAMYEAATVSLGFGLLECGKTMGLAPYSGSGLSRTLPFPELLGQLHAGRSAPNIDGTNYVGALKSWREYFSTAFGDVTTPVELLERDSKALAIAASAQRTVENVYRVLYAEALCSTGRDRVCLAGGVALNSVANGKLPGSCYVPPWAHDAGVALGAAWVLEPPARGGLEPAASPYLGRTIAETEGADAAREAGLHVEQFSVSESVRQLTNGGIGAVAAGRAEIGPRALGHRSIIALPRPAAVHRRLNALKRREMWRPFAPVSTAEAGKRLWPSHGPREQYMVGNEATSGYARAVMPAAVHVDGTTRPQVLEEESHLRSILRELESGGHPGVLVNTSFNGRGEPIVDSAQDALKAFQSMPLDFVILGNLLVTKTPRGTLARA